MARAQTPTDDYILALICLIQAVELLSAMVNLRTSPANDQARKALDRADRLIDTAADLMGIHKTEGDD